MRIMLLLIIAISLMSATAIATGLMPARLTLTPTNSCFSSTKLCGNPAELNCDTAASEPCPGGETTCKKATYTVPNSNPVEKRHYCICTGAGSSPDPSNQPDWPCGIYGTTYGGVPTTLTCANGEECSVSCSMSISGGCATCGC